MKPINRFLFLLPVGLFAGLLAAQAPTHVRPDYSATHEGNGTFTYPFGRGYSSASSPGEAAVQTILESSYVTNQPIAAIAAIYFRHDGETFDRVMTGFTQDVTVQLATVPTNPLAITTDPVGNLGGATPFTVFSGPLNVPASNAQPVAPRAFGIAIPFNNVYTYNAYNSATMSLDHLLIDVRVTPLMDNSQYIRIDSILYRSAYIEGDTEAYVTDCANSAGELLTFIPSKSNFLLGGSLDATLTSKIGSTATPGIFPAAMIAIGATHSELDLSVLGLNACWWSPALDVTTFLADSGAGFPAFSAPVPNIPALADLLLYTQAFGLGASLADSVTSEAYWMKVGPMPFSNRYWPFASIFTNKASTATTWTSLNNAGPLSPVIGFSGSL